MVEEYGVSSITGNGRKAFAEAVKEALLLLLFLLLLILLLLFFNYLFVLNIIYCSHLTMDQRILIKLNKHTQLRLHANIRTM